MIILQCKADVNWTKMIHIHNQNRIKKAKYLTI